MQSGADIVDQIPSMNKTQRLNLRNNISSRLEVSPSDPAAKRALDALDAFEKDNAKPPSFAVTGDLKWEKRPPEKIYIFKAFYGEKVVGYIYKDANHSSKEKDVYTVEILGEKLKGRNGIPKRFHHINDARIAGARRFEIAKENDAL